MVMMTTSMPRQRSGPTDLQYSSGEVPLICDTSNALASMESGDIGVKPLVAGGAYFTLRLAASNKGIDSGIASELGLHRPPLALSKEEVNASNDGSDRDKANNNTGCDTCFAATPTATLRVVGGRA